MVSTKQRSWIENLQRRFSGDKHVAVLILHHGAPELFDAPLQRNKPTPELLQSILEDGMYWHASLLQSLVEHDERPGLAHARQMSNLEQSARANKKRQAFLVAKHKLFQGMSLPMARDSKKKL